MARLRQTWLGTQAHVRGYASPDRDAWHRHRPWRSDRDESTYAHSWTEQQSAASKLQCGHLEPAAGMIGLQSLLSALIACAGAPNAQLRVLNPKVAATLDVCSDRWPLQGAISRLPLSSERVAAGVSSFGYSGTIAHAIDRPQRRRLRSILRRQPAYCSSLPSQSLRLERSPRACQRPAYALPGRAR